MKVRDLAQCTAVLAVLTLPIMVNQLVYAGVGCPESTPIDCTCPDAVPVCAPMPCTGNGSVLKSAPWDCQDNSGNLTQCLTATVPQGTTTYMAVCYIVYTCFQDQNRGCVPNENVVGQPFSKVIKLAVNCKGNPGGPQG